jgi:hypothetical protein
MAAADICPGRTDLAVVSRRKKTAQQTIHTMVDGESLAKSTIETGSEVGRSTSNGIGFGGFRRVCVSLGWRSVACLLFVCWGE